MLKTEARTIRAMIELYCHSHHGRRKGLCSECTGLLEYAGSRLKNCPFKEDKPACSQCPVHCYRKDMRDKIRAVMNYAGPRMIMHHPVLALVHLTKARKESPKK